MNVIQYDTHALAWLNPMSTSIDTSDEDIVV